MNTYTKKVFTTMTSILVPLLLVLTYSCATEVTFLDEHGGNNSKVLPLTITPESGAVALGTPITITSATAGVTIYYYKEGESPAVYSEGNKPRIDAAMTIYAVAALDGYARSDIASKTYTIAATQTQSLFVGGDFGNWAGYYHGVVGINPNNAAPDKSLSVKNSVNRVDTKMLVLPNNEGYILYGIFDYANGSNAYLEKYSPSGELDAEFMHNLGSGPNAPVLDVALLFNGSMLLGGRFTEFNGEVSHGAAVINGDGKFNYDFNLLGEGIEYETRKEHLTAVGVDAGGNYILAGPFRKWNGVRIIDAAPGTTNCAGTKVCVIKVTPNGLIDPDFLYADGGPDIKATIITQVKFDEFDNLYLCGDFETFSKLSIAYLARIDADTNNVDPTFNLNTGKYANEPVLGIALAPDGKIFAYGTFGEWWVGSTGYEVSGIVKLNYKFGTLYTGSDFESPTSKGTTVSAMTVDQITGEVYIATTFGGGKINSLAAFDAVTGATDHAFAPTSGFNSPSLSIGLMNSMLLATGKFTTYDQMQTNTVAKFGLLGGEFSSTFNDTIVDYGAFDSTVRALMCTNDELIVGGAFSNIYPYFTKINASGVMDEDFAANGGPNNQVLALASLPDGRILLGGDFTTYAGESRNYVAMVSPAGILDGSFDAGAVDSSVYAIKVQPDGKILMGGNFTSLNNYIARVDTAGALDPAFLGGGPDNGAVRAIAIQSDGGIIAAGNFTSYDGIPSNYLVGLTSDGLLNVSFDLSAGGPNSPVYATAIQPDGKVLIAGDFTSVNGIARNYIARLNPDGSVDATFDPGVGPNNSVYSLLVNADGTIYIGGDFTTYNREPRKRLALLFSTDGSLAPSFMSSHQDGFDNTVWTIAACQ